MIAPALASWELPSGIGDSVPELVARFASGDKFLSVYDAEHAGFILASSVVRADADPLIGDRVAIRFAFADRTVEIVALCRVLERVTAPSTGWLVEFERSDEVRREMVLACARGENIPVRKKREVRLPVMFSLRILEGSDGGRESLYTLNISESGIGFLGDRRRPTGSRLELRISIGRFSSIRLSGLVTSCEPVVMSNKFRIGVALEFPDERRKLRWKRLIAASVVTPRRPLPSV